jgi:ubiquinone/menaquinone biosynthesis C-methylase UbiE
MAGQNNLFILGAIYDLSISYYYERLEMTTNSIKAGPTFDMDGVELSEDDFILDLGTKDGTKFEEHPGTTIGIDINNSQFSGDSETEFILGDGRQLPFDSNVFDYVHCSAVLEHVDGSDALIAEAARVLKPSGAARFGFPNRISLLQPHNGIPRYDSLLPKACGRIVAP